MKDDIKFSIVIAVYNNTDTIERCLKSIYNQTYRNFEVILSDDCSDIDYFYLKDTFPDLIVIKSSKNRGAGPTRQKGIDIATGDWLLFVDQDDELYNRSALYSLYYSIRRHPDAALIQGHYLYIEREGGGEHDHYEIEHGDIRPLHGIAFNMSFMHEHNIRFHDTLRYSEDVYFNLLFRLMIKYKHKNKEKGIVYNKSMIYKQHRTENSITMRKYDGQNYFEGTYPDTVNLYIYLYDLMKDIVDMHDKVGILLTPILYAMTIYATILYYKTENKFDILMNFSKDVVKIIDKFKKEFCMESGKDIHDVIYNEHRTNVNSLMQDTSLNICDKTETFIESFDYIYSLYTFVKDGIPYTNETNKSTILLSVIIPVFNSKNIIHDTLDKLYKNIDQERCEVIIVNDASPDGDYDYLNDMYFNLKVVTNECNKGYANSRQLGIDVARGKWVIFLDHDDEILSGIMDELDEAERMAIPYQLLNFAYERNLEKKGFECVRALDPDIFHGSIYRLDYLRDINVRFLSQLKTSEDTYFNRVVYDRLNSSYRFLIKTKLSTPIYRWIRKNGATESTGIINGRTWSEEYYGQYIRSRILALNFNFDVLSYHYKISELYQLLFTAVQLSNNWKEKSLNYRTDINDDIMMIVAELYKYIDKNCRRNDFFVNLINEINANQRFSHIDELNMMKLDDILLQKCIKNFNYKSETVKKQMITNVLQTFVSYSNILEKETRYKNIYIVNSPEIKSDCEFKFSHINQTELMEKLDSLKKSSIFIYAIKSSQDLEYIYKNLSNIKSLFGNDTLYFFMEDDIYWKCDKKIINDVCVYTVNNFNHNNVLSMNQDFRYLLLSKYEHTSV